MSIYEIAVEDDRGSKVLLERYKGKVLLIVNSATNCIFTPQYRLLQAIYDQFKTRGFEVLDFPCNQFLNQAPGTIEEINKFCADKYDTTFPRFAKLFVNGPDESILYTYLKAKKGGIFSSRIKWNFTKFLVDKNGCVVKRYAPNVKPDRIVRDIEKLLLGKGGK
jgi:glutathione peroxidase